MKKRYHLNSFDKTVFVSSTNNVFHMYRNR